MQAVHITLHIIFYEASYFDVSFWPSIATLNLFCVTVNIIRLQDKELAIVVVLAIKKNHNYPCQIYRFRPSCRNNSSSLFKMHNHFY